MIMKMKIMTKLDYGDDDDYELRQIKEA